VVYFLKISIRRVRVNRLRPVYREGGHLELIKEIVLDEGDSNGPTPLQLSEVSRRFIAEALEASYRALNVVQKLLASEKLAPRDALALADRSCSLATKAQQLIEGFYDCDTNFRAAAERERTRLDQHDLILMVAMMVSKSVRFRRPLPEAMVPQLVNARIKIDEILAHHKQCTAEEARRRMSFRITERS
jgi:hypothetical protein